MVLTVHLPRRRPRSVDLVVSWSGTWSATHLCDALAEHLAEPVPSLWSRGQRVPADAPVGVPPLVHGSSVAVLGGRESTTGAGPRFPPSPDAGGPPSPRAGALEVAVVGGPDSGRSALLAPPGLTVGRSHGAGLRVADDAMSRVHLTFTVTPSGVTVDDGSSTNGVVVDGRPTQGPTSVDTSSTIVVGASTLALRRRPGAGLPVTSTGDGRLTVRPSHGPRPVDPSPVVTAPADPGERRRTRVPWVGALVPIPVAGLLAVLLGPQMLAFALLGPTVMLGSALADRWGAGREHREARAAHRVATAEARSRLEAHLTRECARRRDSRPDPHRVLQTAEHRHPGLWQHPGPQPLRLGLGDLPAETTWVEGSTRTHPTARLVPVTVDLKGARRLGVVGDRGATDRVLGWLIGQLAADVPPSLLRIGVATSDPGWNWVRLLPHWWDPSDALGASGTDPAAAPVTLVVVAPEPRPLEGAPWARRLADGALVIVAATTGAALAGGCGAVLTQRPGRWQVESDDGEVSLSPDLVGAWWVDRLARALAPLRPAAEQGSVRALPRSVGLAEVLAVPEVTAQTVAASWGPEPRSERATPRPPVAPVGLCPSGVLSIDLVRDGPHVLVGGTTGSGKSEFLRTLVTSLSVRCPPEDLTFVLVDFKGGSAFGSCARLPHVVGLVTDLDEHLVDRALRSLGAELRRRERIFADAGARDLAEFQRRRAADSEPVPRLVVVIDELRALVDELPHFVSGLVRLAALGRSLGVHLVLATQRPAGAVTAEVQANVNLRIAFRMRDRADSMDVLDDAGAADLPSDVPGRAMARGGDGHVATFQAGALSHSAAATGPWLRVRPSDTDDPQCSDRPATGSHRSVVPDSLDHTSSLDAVDVDASRDVIDPADSVVDAIVSAHSGRDGHPPRAPWLAPLPAVVGFSSVREPGGCGQGVALLDQPDRQLVSVLGPPRGTWLLSGPPGSGRTTAALGVALASATAEPATSLHLHVIGSGGALSDLDGLHHLGTRLEVRDHTTIRHLVQRLRAEVDRRLGATRDHPTQLPRPGILTVVDGWDQLVESQPDAGHDRLADEVVRLLRDGASVGVRGLVTGGRSLLQPRWAGLGAELFLLGAIDTLTAALAGVPARELPADPPPGRAVRVADRLHLQFARPGPGDVASVAAASATASSTRPPLRLRPLPTHVRRSAVLALPHLQPADPRALLLGIAGDEPQPFSIAPDTVGRRLAVVGPRGSGRTTALQVLAGSALARGRTVAVLSSTPAEWQGLPGCVVTGHTAPGPLVDLRRRCPDLVLLVDDADLLDGSAGEPVVREVAELADRDDGLVVVATTPRAVATRFRGVDVEVCRERAGLLLRPQPGDGELLGAPRLHGIPAVQGRGVFVAHGSVTEVQVLVDEASAGGVSVGVAVGRGPVGPGGEGDEGGHDGHGQDGPAHREQSGLDQGPADWEQEQVPHDRRGARPLAGTEPATGEHGEGDGRPQDQQGRHDDATGVAALADDQLIEVERRESGEREGLHRRDDSSDAAGAE